MAFSHRLVPTPTQNRAYHRRPPGNALALSDARLKNDVHEPRRGQSMASYQVPAVQAAWIL